MSLFNLGTEEQGTKSVDLVTTKELTGTFWTPMLSQRMLDIVLFRIRALPGVVKLPACPLWVKKNLSPNFACKNTLAEMETIKLQIVTSA